jgi:hypothetical protein
LKKLCLLDLKTKVQSEKVGGEKNCIYNVSGICGISSSMRFAPNSAFTGSSLVRKEYKSEKIYQIPKVRSRGIIRLAHLANRLLESYKGKMVKRIDRIDILRALNIEKKKTRLKQLSPRSKKKIRNKINAWFLSEKKRFSFLTLTFISEVTEEKALTCLNSFLTRLRQKYKQKGLNYLWVCEFQKNGNPHYHILVNFFLPIRQLNDLWIKVQYNHGVKYGDYGLDEILKYDSYYHNGKRKNKSYLNPADIDRVQTYKGLGIYVSKYISKNDHWQRTQIWNCSKQISQLATGFVNNNSLWKYIQKNELNFNSQTGEIVKPYVNFLPYMPVFNKEVLSWYGPLIYFNRKYVFSQNKRTCFIGSYKENLKNPSKDFFSEISCN